MGHIIYDGPSQIDGAPIIAIALEKSQNKKTGNVVQTYILRKDINPRKASKLGLDFSICGACPHRGQATADPNRKIAKNRSCYVNLGQGPTIVYKGYVNNLYSHVSGHENIAKLGKNRVVRLGAYGDPAAVPGYIWDSLISESKSFVGYTHQHDYRPDLCMISADTLEQAQEAWSKGYRTFRTVKSYDEMKSNEIACPASTGVNCVDCRLCGGVTTKSPKSIAIEVHGVGKSNFEGNLQNV